jgi:pimeloyl-ACP methyl ester carboxylesterase
MDEVISSDGTPIAYEAVGSGPTVVLVGGAFCDHTATAELADALASDFTAVSYDRRGQGASGDTLPYDVRREVADIEALIRCFGDRAMLHGMSAGAALSLVATAAGAPVDAVSGVEPPYRVSEDAPRLPEGEDAFAAMVSSGSRGDTVAFFMTHGVGLAPEVVAQMRRMPMWPGLEAMAHTLVYEVAALGSGAGRLPEEMLADFPVPVLTVYSKASPAWLQAGAAAVAAAVPAGECVGLDGVFHEVPAATIAPVLREFYRRAR